VRDKVDWGFKRWEEKKKESRGSNLTSTSSTNKNTQGDERTNIPTIIE
jgi:hypothetical protein